MTAPGRCCSKAASSAAVSRMSPLTSGPQRTKSAWPLERSSNATGSQPDAASALQVWLPMKPAPPVTRTVSIDQLCFQRPLNEISPGKGRFCVSERHYRLHTPGWASQVALGPDHPDGTDDADDAQSTAVLHRR